MDLFEKAESVRLRNRKDKYLIAMDDKELVSQSWKGSNNDAIWRVEFVEGRQDALRLKSYFGKYLTATNTPFIPGVSGKKVIQADLPEKITYPSAEWEPIRDGFQCISSSLSMVFGAEAYRDKVIDEDAWLTEDFYGPYIWACHDLERVDLAQEIDRFSLVVRNLDADMSAKVDEYEQGVIANRHVQKRAGG
uniref:DUF569 domain-containing protein n=1 Tax=Nicotiana tabacum TaxID=4097 RepID=A0A1S3ZXV0_TOBAC|nr:PREDICTED: uncharacterized protein LOC107791549 [Nicotiana tabacum]